MATDHGELLQGTLEMLVLRTLALEPMHGWGIAQRIQQTSRDTLKVQQGSLYPALQRMRRRGWLSTEWRVTENNRRARYYVLCPDDCRPAAARHRASGLGPDCRSDQCSPEWRLVTAAGASLR